MPEGTHSTNYPGYVIPRLFKRSYMNAAVEQFGARTSIVDGTIVSNSVLDMFPLLILVSNICS